MTTEWERTRPPLKRITSPAAPGNDLAVKHGVDSERRWRPIAERLAAELLAERPWLAGHRRTVDAWARVEAQATLIADWLNEHGWLDENNEPRKACDRLDRLESRAQSLRNDLAEPPMAMARLLGALTATAVTAGAQDAVAALQADGAAFVAAYLARTSDDPHAALAPGETVAASDCIEGGTR